MSDDEKKKIQNVNEIRAGAVFGNYFHGMAPEHEKVKNWNKNAPDWRKATPGVNLEGDCTNQSCAAHKKGRVIIPWGRRHFDFFEDEHKSVCPVCAKYVQPIICGFTNTQWRATGIRKTGPGVAAEKVDFPWKTAPEGKYTTFDDDPKNYARWKDLRIEVTPIRG